MSTQFPYPPIKTVDDLVVVVTVRAKLDEMRSCRDRADALHRLACEVLAEASGACTAARLSSEIAELERQIAEAERRIAKRYLIAAGACLALQVLWNVVG